MEFSLEEALTAVAGSSRRNEIPTFISPIREAHTNDEDTSEVTLAFQSASEGCQYEMSTRSVFMKTLKQGAVWHFGCLEFLSMKGPTLMLRSLVDKHEISSVLLMMADNVMTAQEQAAEAPAWDMLDMSMWYKSLSALIEEMKTVQDQFPSVIDNYSGVYVVSSAPYDAFLRALAAEVADRCG